MPEEPRCIPILVQGIEHLKPLPKGVTRLHVSEVEHRTDTTVDLQSHGHPVGLPRLPMINGTRSEIHDYGGNVAIGGLPSLPLPARQSDAHSVIAQRNIQPRNDRWVSAAVSGRIAHSQYAAPHAQSSCIELH